MAKVKPLSLAAIFFAVSTVGQRTQIRVAGLIDLHHAPVAQRDGRVREVRVLDDIEDVRGGSGLFGAGGRVGARMQF